MAEIKSTRLRAFRSKKLDVLLASISKLGFKIEIKGNPVFVKGTWTVFGVLPDEDIKRLNRWPLVTEFKT